jgi:ribosomal protein S18 acetylase RimI-like enzyme
LSLIELAFGEALDAEARRALRGMRPPPLIAPLIALLDDLSPPGEGMMPGFVWLENGCVIGTASVRRVHSSGRGWLVSNVAVHPEKQGRGIGRALLEASLEFAQDRGGTWVILQVRDDNVPARNLYESLDFRSIGEVVRLSREAGAPIPRLASVDSIEKDLRPARWYDGEKLYRLARTLMTYDVLWSDALSRSSYRTGLWSRILARMQGRRRGWWVQDKGALGLQGGIGIEVDPRNPWHRLRLLTVREARDESLAKHLVDFGLRQLSGARELPVETEYPASDEAGQAALAEAGFVPLYSLVHMRLDLLD